MKKVYEVRFDASVWFIRATSFGAAVEAWNQRMTTEDLVDGLEPPKDGYEPDEVRLHTNADVII